VVSGVTAGLQLHTVRTVHSRSGRNLLRHSLQTQPVLQLPGGLQLIGLHAYNLKRSSSCVFLFGIR